MECLARPPTFYMIQTSLKKNIYIYIYIYTHVPPSVRRPPGRPGPLRPACPPPATRPHEESNHVNYVYINKQTYIYVYNICNIYIYTQLYVCMYYTTLHYTIYIYIYIYIHTHTHTLIHMYIYTHITWPATRPLSSRACAQSSWRCGWGAGTAGRGPPAACYCNTNITYICMYVCMYIYIYIQRERESISYYMNIYHMIISSMPAACDGAALLTWGYGYNFTNYKFKENTLNLTPLARSVSTLEGFLIWHYTWWTYSQLPIWTTR